jgi:hypothetical protein
VDVPTVGEIVFTVFDWMTTNKETIKSTRDVWEYTRSLFPEENNLSGFQEVMTILRRHRLETLKTIPVCVNMCVPFWNPTHPSLQGSEYINAHRTRCPKCGEDRYLSDGTTERRRIYYFPLKEWFQDIYTKPDLSRFMDNDMSFEGFPTGHVRRSDGWRKKAKARKCANDALLLHVVNIQLNHEYIMRYSCC